MNRRLWACVMAGVLVAHIAVIFIIANIRTIRNPPPKPFEPTFGSSTVTVVDEQGRKVRERSEYTVETKLADEALLKKLSPPAGTASSQ